MLGEPGLGLLRRDDGLCCREHLEPALVSWVLHWRRRWCFGRSATVLGVAFGEVAGRLLDERSERHARFWRGVVLRDDVVMLHIAFRWEGGPVLCIE